MSNATAAGDSFLGGFIAAAMWEVRHEVKLGSYNNSDNKFVGDGICGVFNPQSHNQLDSAIEFGMKCAEATVGYEGTVSANKLKSLL